ncbi:MAG: Na+/H+ antiporter NhaA [Acidimicrobiia bacterium]
MPPEPERIHETWLSSDRRIPTRFIRPLVRFTHVEAAGGIVLLGAAIAALGWANSPFGESYERFWDNHLTIEIGAFHFNESLKEVVNDALMAVFFFVVGLEIKREIAVGDLRDPKRAALPAVAALGGMLIPALIFTAFAAGTGGEAARGWGIPMATDIAFAVGVVSLLGRRVSVGAKLFLLALAIADDIGAIAVIAIFYTSDLSFVWLGAAIAGLLLVSVANRVGIRSMLFYGVAGVAVWFFVFESGVHATLAGVALGFLTPALPLYSDESYIRRSRLIVGTYEMDAAAPRKRERIDASALDLSFVARESVAPLDRLERVLHPWSSFAIVPVFALANAGVRFTDMDTGELLTNPVTLGVAFGLVIGKLVGITAATWIAVKTGIGKLPKRTGWTQIVGLALLAGIGFTVSLFITELAYTAELLTNSAKTGIFIGSGVAGIAGFLFLRSGSTPEAELEEGKATMSMDDEAASAPVDTPAPAS